MNFKRSIKTKWQAIQNQLSNQYLQMRNKQVNYLLALLLVFVAAIQPVNAQTSRALSLQEAIELGVKNSYELKMNQAKVMEASAAVKEALDARLPDASASAAYLRLTHPTIDLKAKTGSGSGSSQPAPGVSSAAYAITNVSMPLYAGGRIKYGIQSLKYLEEAAKLDADNDREAVVMNIINAYDNLYKAQAAVKVVKENLESNRQRVKDFSNLEKNGILARNDLLKSELQTSTVELALLDAENNARLANYNMTLMLGLSESTEIIPSIGSITPANNLKALEEYVQLALQNRKDLAAVALRKKASTVGVQAAKGELYPSLAVTGGNVSETIANLIPM